MKIERTLHDTKNVNKMKHELKSLRHNGIYVPPYDYKGFSIIVRGRPIKLSSRTEQMAVAWVRKTQSVTSPPDKIFYCTFIRVFLERLTSENSSSDFLKQFSKEYLETIQGESFEWSNNPNSANQLEIDFSEISTHLAQEKLTKEAILPTEKKKLAEQRKAQREALKEKFGYAFIDGKKVEIANWTAEPSCLFTGRGEHPRRGRWKEGPMEEDIILNLSPESPTPAGGWKNRVWEPDKIYIAKWEDKLTGKLKYVWLSDSTSLKQSREREKFDRAESLGKAISKIDAHIRENLEAEDEERRKVTTVAWLIFKLNMRVGDEKDPGEADTVGAITLRPQHAKIEDGKLHFDFLGKDAVRWEKSVDAPPAVIRNIESYSKTCKEYLFEGIDSKKVSRFLSEKMKGLTAKVFRTWRTTHAVREYLNESRVRREDSESTKLLHAKRANLKAAQIANHKRKIPANFKERLAKKEARAKELELQLKQKTVEGKKTEALHRRIEKARTDVELMKETEEWNLGTSLKSYIDPRVYAKWAAKVDFSLDKIYSKTLRKKYSWALGKLLESEESVCATAVPDETV